MPYSCYDSAQFLMKVECKQAQSVHQRVEQMLEDHTTATSFRSSLPPFAEVFNELRSNLNRGLNNREMGCSLLTFLPLTHGEDLIHSERE